MKLEDLQLQPKDIARFWSKVNKNLAHGPQGECWLWTGATNRPKHSQWAYGFFRTCRGGIRATHYAHRLSYLLAGGEIEDGQVVMHSCDFSRCVNPAHLFAGQPFQNMHDKWAKGRSGYGGSFPVTCMFTLSRIAHRGGFTQAALAEESGIPLPTIARLWQNKAMHIDISILSRLSEVLGCAPGDFFEKAA